MELCDFCEGPATNVCACYNAVYCSEECQRADRHDHIDECIHPSKMTDEEVQAEIGIQMDHPYEDGDLLLGEDIAESSNPRQWLIDHIEAGFKRSFGRMRVKRKTGATRRKIRKTRRDGRKARKGTRKAKGLTRKQGVLDRATNRKNKNEASEDRATGRAL